MFMRSSSAASRIKEVKNVKINARKIRTELLSLIMMTGGAVLAAFALEEFLAPNDIFDGGVVGIAMITDIFLPLDLGMLVIIINIPFLILGFRLIGKIFLAKAAYSMIVFSIMTNVFAPLANATEDKILATAFGGVLLGAGVGLVLKGGGCLDGTEIVALLLSPLENIVMALMEQVIGSVGYHSPHIDPPKDCQP